MVYAADFSNLDVAGPMARKGYKMGEGEPFILRYGVIMCYFTIVIPNCWEYKP
jgi:hypothetical protein